MTDTGRGKTDQNERKGGRRTDGHREGELIAHWGEGVRRGTCEGMGMESGRGPGGCNLLSVANTQQMCGAEDRERRGESNDGVWGCCREGTQTVGALSRPAGSLSAVTSPPALRPDRFISTNAHTQ